MPRNSRPVRWLYPAAPGDQPKTVRGSWRDPSLADAGEDEVSGFVDAEVERAEEARVLGVPELPNADPSEPDDDRHTHDPVPSRRPRARVRREAGRLPRVKLDDELLVHDRRDFIA